MTTVAKHYAIVSKKSKRFFLFDNSDKEGKYVDAISVADMMTLGAMPTMFPEKVSMFSTVFKRMVVVHITEVDVQKYVVFPLAGHTSNEVEWVPVTIKMTLPDFFEG
jgi:hypothetical protein